MSLQELAGKTVVVEFWASWCAPCVGALPEWNQLVGNFTGEDVVFLALTDEDSPRKLRAFLGQNPIRGHVGIDRDRSIFDAFGVHRIPTTVVITSDGTVHRGLAGLPDAEQIEAVQRSVPVDFRVRGASRRPGLPAEPAARLFSLDIRPSEQEDHERSVHVSGKYHAKAHTLAQVASFAYQDRAQWLTLDSALPEESYDVDAECAAGLACVRAALRFALHQSFAITGTVEQMEQEVWSLRATGSLGSSLRPTDPDHPPRPRHEEDFVVVELSSDQLAARLEQWLGQPVFDETGLEGRFDGSLSFNHGDPDSLKRAVRDQWGLLLEEDRRVLAVTVIRQEQGDPEGHLEAGGVGSLAGGHS
jgi:uncharacterized protein (TIGR03435 family)